MKVSAVNFQTQIKNEPKLIKRFDNTYSNKTLSIPAFYGKDLVQQYSREKTIEFLKNNPTPIATGTDGIIYKLGTSAIKVGKTKETSFEAEAEILKQLPKSLKNTQKYIDRFSFDGKDVLVSSFVQGTHKKALIPQDFLKVFEVILEHDKANIIHGDLNLGNIMFSPNGETSLIDYGAAYKPTSTEVELYPSFVANTNALKFENTGVCDSLKIWQMQGNKNENFIEYLKSKASFYKKHSTLIENEETKKYENNLSIVLAEPSQQVVATELKRLQTLDLLEMSDTATNYDNDPHSAIDLWNRTVESAKEFEQETKSRLEETEDKDEQIYYSYQHQIAKCFHSTLTEWKNGTINWLLEIKNENYTPRSEIEEKLQKNWNK